jgi:hypothetical protein
VARIAFLCTALLCTACAPAPLLHEEPTPIVQTACPPLPPQLLVRGWGRAEDRAETLAQWYMLCRDAALGNLPAQTHARARKTLEYLISVPR